MSIILGLSAVVALIIWTFSITSRICQRTPAMANSRSLLNGALCVWVLNTFHRAAIWIPALNGRGGYDGTGHDQLAHAVSADLSSGKTSIFHLEFLGNDGYRNFLGVFYALTEAPSFVAIAIHGMMAYCGLLFILEAVAIASSAARIPKWLIAYTLFLPSAHIFTPWLLKEAPVLWGIGLLLRFGVAPKVWMRSIHASLLTLVGVLVVFCMRPHIGGAWLIAVAVGHFAPLKRPDVATASTLAGLVVFAVTMSVADRIAPGFSSNAEEKGVIDTLDQMTDHAMGGSAVYRETTPLPFLNGLIFVLFEPNPLYWANLNYAIVGIEAWFITLAILYQWWKVPEKVRLLMTPPAVICVVAVLSIAFYLGYMYNLGLMVRQRLQVMPAMILLAGLPLGIQKNRARRPD